VRMVFLISGNAPISSSTCADLSGCLPAFVRDDDPTRRNPDLESPKPYQAHQTADTPGRVVGRPTLGTTPPIGSSRGADFVRHALFTCSESKYHNVLYDACLKNRKP
jgi:hypothetical protein